MVCIVKSFVFWCFAEKTSVIQIMMLELEILCQKFCFTPKCKSISVGEGGEGGEGKTKSHLTLKWNHI